LALLVLWGLLSLGMFAGTDATGQGHPDGSRWVETHGWKGNCTQKPVHQYFLVNNTALYMDFVIDFNGTSSFPGASLVVYGPDSFVLFSESIDVLHYEHRIGEITKRGRWKASLSVNYCSFDHPFEYRSRVNVTNRALTLPIPDDGRTEVGEDVVVSVAGLALSAPEKCRVDWGDGSDTGWSAQTQFTKAYDRPGTYKVRTMVQAEDGSMTGWSDTLVVTVEGEDHGTGNDGTHIAFIGMVAVLWGLCMALGLTRT